MKRLLTLIPLVLIVANLTGCQALIEEMERQQEAEYSFYAKRYGLSRDEVDFLKAKQAEMERKAANERYQRYLEEEGRRIREQGYFGNNRRTSQTHCYRIGNDIHCNTY